MQKEQLIKLLEFAENKDIFEQIGMTKIKEQFSLYIDLTMDSIINNTCIHTKLILINELNIFINDINKRIMNLNQLEYQKGSSLYYENMGFKLRISNLGLKLNCKFAICNKCNNDFWINPITNDIMLNGSIITNCTCTN